MAYFITLYSNYNMGWVNPTQPNPSITLKGNDQFLGRYLGGLGHFWWVLGWVSMCLLLAHNPLGGLAMTLYPPNPPNYHV